jgi:hypothetical protein
MEPSGISISGERQYELLNSGGRSEQKLRMLLGDWLFDYHPGQLSQKRLTQKWGWINGYLFWKKEKVMDQH